MERKRERENSHEYSTSDSIDFKKRFGKKNAFIFLRKLLVMRTMLCIRYYF